MHCCAPKICDKSGFGTPAPFAPGPPVYSSSGKAGALCNQHTYTYPQYPLKNTLSQKSQYRPIDFSLVHLGRMTMLQIGEDLASDVFLFRKITLFHLDPYMQKTCDVAGKAILAKKKLRKKCVNRDKM